MFKIIFWDNDGVLVDTEKIYFQACSEIFQINKLGKLTYQKYTENYLLKKDTDVLILPKNILKNPKTLMKERDQLYIQLLQKKVPIMPNIAKTLEKLYQKIPMAVVTSSQKYHFELIMERTGLKKYFDFAITRNDVKNGKPDPEPYLLAIKKSGLPAKNCLVIEDSEKGLIAAKAAGLCCYVIPNDLTKSGDFSKADKILESPLELLEEL